MGRLFVTCVLWAVVGSVCADGPVLPDTLTAIRNAINISENAHLNDIQRGIMRLLRDSAFHLKETADLLNETVEHLMSSDDAKPSTQTGSTLGVDLFAQNPSSSGPALSRKRRQPQDGVEEAPLEAGPGLDAMDPTYVVDAQQSAYALENPAGQQGHLQGPRPQPAVEFPGRPLFSRRLPMPESSVSVEDSRSFSASDEMDRAKRGDDDGLDTISDDAVESVPEEIVRKRRESTIFPAAIVIPDERDRNDSTMSQVQALTFIESLGHMLEDNIRQIFDLIRMFNTTMASKHSSRSVSDVLRRKKRQISGVDSQIAGLLGSDPDLASLSGKPSLSFSDAYYRLQGPYEREKENIRRGFLDALYEMRVRSVLHDENGAYPTFRPPFTTTTSTTTTEPPQVMRDDDRRGRGRGRSGSRRRGGRGGRYGTGREGRLSQTRQSQLLQRRQQAFRSV